MESLRPMAPRAGNWDASGGATLKLPSSLQGVYGALLDAPRRWARHQLPLLVAVLASLSVHGLPYIGLGSLVEYFAAHASEKPPPIEIEIDMTPQPELTPAPRMPEPEAPAVAVPPPEPKRKVREPKPRERPAAPPEEAHSAEPVPASAAPAPAGPAVAMPVEQATATGCLTGVCLPVGHGGPGRMGATGTGNGTGNGHAPVVARAPEADKEAVPLFRVQPSYPELAAERELEGWVLVSFSISKTGVVSAPRVLKSSTARIFDQAALDAILKWKYQPTLRAGQAVERAGVTVKIIFKLE